MSSLISRPYRIDDFFPDFFRRFAQPSQFAGDIAGEIKVDVTEKDNEYQVRAEIPGAKKEDIRVSVEGNFVSIAAEVKQEKEERSKAGRILVKETSYGSMARGFSLASEIDDKSVVAKLEDGVLKLTLPKRQGSGVRQIAVQ